MPNKVSQSTKLVVIAIITIVILYYVNRHFSQVKFDKNGNRMVTEQQIKNAFQKLVPKYGVAYARKVEQLFRIETGHFKSGQFLKTFSPGMEASKNHSFPFGWSSLNEYCTATGVSTLKFYTHTMNENGTGKSKTFIGFPTIDDSVNFVAWFIKNKRGGSFGKWYSLNTASAASYENTLNTVIPRYV